MKPQVNSLVLAQETWENADVGALQALNRGEATPEQQQRALKWIMRATQYRAVSFRSGPNGDRDTAFAEGKRFIGYQILKIVEMDLPAVLRAEAELRKPQK